MQTHYEFTGVEKMKIRATYTHMFEVWREIEIDEADFREWADKYYGVPYEDGIALDTWVELEGLPTGTFPVWKEGEPLPTDFEYQGWSVSTERVDERENGSRDDG